MHKLALKFFEQCSQMIRIWITRADSIMDHIKKDKVIEDSLATWTIVNKGYL